MVPSVFRYDLKAKWANETHIGLAKDYVDSDAWEKVALSDDSAGGEGGEGEDAAAEASEE